MAVSLTPPNLVPIVSVAGNDLITVWPTGTGGPLSKITFTGFAASMATQLNTSYLQISQNLADVGNATTARTNLGLGTMAVQNANAVNITGGSITGVSGVRRQLIANETYFVRADGNDSNTGLTNTAGGAWLTLQKACNFAGQLDFAGWTMTVNVNGGGYAGNVLLTIPWVGGGTLAFVGNVGTPAAVAIQPAAGHAIRVSCNLTGVLSFAGFRLAAVAGVCLYHDGKGTVAFNAIEFSTASIYQILCSGAGAKVLASGNYAIVSTGVCHLVALDGGIIEITGRTLTLTGAAFSTAFANAGTLGLIECASCTFTGTSTGPRYTVASNAVVNTATGNVNYLPGSLAGSVATGGQYI